MSYPSSLYSRKITIDDYKPIAPSFADAMMANKVITILSVVLFAFVISTTVLAVQKNDQAAEIDDLRAQLDASSTPSPTTTSEMEQTTFELTPTTTPSMDTSPAPTTTTTMATTTEAPLPPVRFRLRCLYFVSY